MPKLSAQQFRDRKKKIEAEVAKRQELVDAYREQRLAALYEGSGWTEREIAREEKLSNGRTHQMLLFGRFLDWLAHNCERQPPKNLTEGRFRDLWTQTPKQLADPLRFKRVAEMLAEAPVRTHRPANVAKRLLEHAGDWKWRAESDMAEALEIPEETVTRTLTRMKEGYVKGARVEVRPGGKGRQWRLRPVTERDRKPLTNVDGPSAALFLDQIKDLTAQGLRYTDRHAAKYSPAFARQLFQELERLSKHFERFVTGKEQRFHCERVKGLYSDEAQPHTKEAQDA